LRGTEKYHCRGRKFDCCPNEDAPENRRERWKEADFANDCSEAKEEKNKEKK